MAKRKREEEFEVSEVAPLQPLSLASLLLRSLALSIFSATVYNDLYQYQCYTALVLYILLCTTNDLYHYQC